MELDKRIIEGKHPLTCFDTEQAQNFVGKKCYLTNDISLFSDLDSFKDTEGCSDAPYVGVIDRLTNINKELSMVFDTTFLRWKFCIPCEWVEEEKKEPKYRPFTGIEFAEKFNLKLNSIIHLRGVPTDDHCYNYKVVFTGYRWCDDVFQVFLNGSWLDLPKLLELYEYEENGEWQPFGIIDESQE